MQQGEGVTTADSVETLGVDLRTRVKRLGAKEKARRKKCKLRFSLIKKNKASRSWYERGWCQRGREKLVQWVWPLQKDKN